MTTQDARPATTGPRIDVPIEALREFCARWRIAEFAFFGSILRDDFRPDSDVDVLVTFDPDARWGLFDLVDMQDELETLFGRPVDLVERPAVEHSRNYIRRKAILSTAQPVAM